MCGTSSRISLISRQPSLIDCTVADITSCVEASRGLPRQSAPSILVDTQGLSDLNASSSQNKRQSSVHNEAVRSQSAHSISVDTEGLPELDVSRSTNLNVSTLKLDQPRECNRCKLAGFKRTPSIARKRANNVFLEDLEGEAVEVQLCSSHGATLRWQKENPNAPMPSSIQQLSEIIWKFSMVFPTDLQSPSLDGISYSFHILEHVVICLRDITGV
ncbi:hypothetical protein Tco_0434338 [Tanacetum coccineum]